MAEPRYRAENVKLYYLGIDSQGNLKTDHFPVAREGNSRQSLESLFPEDTPAHYHAFDLHINQSTFTGVSDQYTDMPNSEFVDYSSPSQYWLDVGYTQYTSSYMTPIYTYTSSSPTKSFGTLYADVVAIPTRKNVDSKFSNIISNYQFYTLQSHGVDNDEPEWKKINVSSTFTPVYHRCPPQVGIQAKTFATQTSSSEDNFNYCPKVDCYVSTIATSGSGQDWMFNERSMIRVHSYLMTANCQFTEHRLGKWASTVKFDEIFESNWNSGWSIENEWGWTGVPGAIEIDLTGEEIKYPVITECKDGGNWKRKIKVKNPNNFPIMLYVCTKKLKSNDEDNWQTTDSTAVNYFEYKTTLAAGATSGEYVIGDWDQYADAYIGAYFIIKYGDYCKLFSTVIDEATSSQPTNYPGSRYFKP